MLLITAACSVLMTAALLFTGRTQAREAELLVDGAVVRSFPLDREAEFTVKAGKYYNVIKTGKGWASIASADCPDKACVRTGVLRKAGSGAVCLPHRLVLRIKGSASDVDSVSW